MKVVGLTGGIGSGKSTIGRFFKILGVPLYNSDERARWLIEHCEEVKRSIQFLFGPESYINGKYNRSFIAQIVFKNPEMLRKINAIVHPQVALDFENWIKNQHAAYILKETAILFESGTYKDCSKIIFVSAPKEIRISRVMKRDGLSQEAVEVRMNSQWPDEEKRKRANFEVINDNKSLLIPELLRIHNYLSRNDNNF